MTSKFLEQFLTKFFLFTLILAFGLIQNGLAQEEPSALPKPVDQDCADCGVGPSQGVLKSSNSKLFLKAVGSLTVNQPEPEAQGLKQASNIYLKYSYINDALLGLKVFHDNPENIKALFTGTQDEVNYRLYQIYKGNKFDMTDLPGPTEQVVLYDYFKALYAGSASKSLAFAATLADKRTVEQKLLLAQLLSYRFYANYDDQRSGASSLSNDEKIPLESVYDTSLQNSIKHSYLKEDLKTISGSQAKGTCGDFASGVAQYLQAMGFKNSWVVAYSMTDGSGHAVAVAIDPNDSKTLYSINGLSRVVVKNKEGGQSLFRGGNDVTLRYDVLDPTGSTKVVLNSSLNNDLKQLAGFHINTFDPLDQSQSWIIRAGGSVGKSGKLIGSFGVSSNSEGQKLLGAAAHANFKQGNYSETQVGAFVGIQNQASNKAIDNGSVVNNLGLAYLRIEQNAHTPCLYLADKKLCGKIEANLALAGSANVGLTMASDFSGTDEKKKSLGYHSLNVINYPEARMQAGVVVDLVTDHVKNRSWLGCQGTYGFKDPRSRLALPSSQLMLNHCAFINQGSIHLGSVQLLAGSVLLHYPGIASTGFGATVGQFKVGAKSAETTALVGLRGPLVSDVPVFLPGAIPQLTFDFSQKLGTHPVELLLSVSQQLKGADQKVGATNISGGAQVSY